MIRNIQQLWHRLLLAIAILSSVIKDFNLPEGDKIEIKVLNLPEIDKMDFVVIVSSSDSSKRSSTVNLIEEIRSQQSSFRSAEAINQQLQEERNSWED